MLLDRSKLNAKSVRPIGRGKSCSTNQPREAPRGTTKENHRKNRHETDQEHSLDSRHTRWEVVYASSTPCRVLCKRNLICVSVTWLSFSSTIHTLVPPTRSFVLDTTNTARTFCNCIRCLSMKYFIAHRYTRDREEWWVNNGKERGNWSKMPYLIFLGYFYL